MRRVLNQTLRHSQDGTQLVVVAGFVCRTHGAPHSGHTPRSLVPALIHGSTSAGGNVAKWASLKLPVAMVQGQ